MNYKECAEECKRISEGAPSGYFYVPSHPDFFAQLFETKDGEFYWLPPGLMACSGEILQSMLIPKNRALDEELNNHRWAPSLRNVNDF